MAEKVNWAELLPTLPSASVSTKTDEGFILDRIRKTLEMGIINAEIGMYRWSDKGPQDEDVVGLSLGKRQPIKELISEFGAKVTVHAGLGIDLSYPWPTTKMESVQKLKHSIFYARDIGAHVVTIHPTGLTGGNAFIDWALYNVETKPPWYGGGELEKKIRQKIARAVGWYTDKYFERMQAWRREHMKRTLELAFGKNAAEVDAERYKADLELKLKWIQGLAQLYGYYKYDVDHAISTLKRHGGEARVQYFIQAAQIISRNIDDKVKLNMLKSLAMKCEVPNPDFSQGGPLIDETGQKITMYLILMQELAAFNARSPKKKDLLDYTKLRLAEAKKAIVEKRLEEAKKAGKDLKSVLKQPVTIEDLKIHFNEDQTMVQARKSFNTWQPGFRGFDARYQPLTGDTFLQNLKSSVQILLADPEVQRALRQGTCPSCGRIYQENILKCKKCNKYLERLKLAFENMQMTNLSTGELGAPYFTLPEDMVETILALRKIAIANNLPEDVIVMTFDILHCAVGMNPNAFIDKYLNLMTERLVKERKISRKQARIIAERSFGNFHISGGPLNAYGGIKHEHVGFGGQGDMILKKFPKVYETLKKLSEKYNIPLTIEPGEQGSSDTEVALKTMWTGGIPHYALMSTDLTEEQLKAVKEGILDPKTIWAAADWGYDQMPVEELHEYYIQEREPLMRLWAYENARSTFLESLYSTAGAQAKLAPAMWHGGMAHREGLPQPWRETFYFSGEGQSKE